MLFLPCSITGNQGENRRDTQLPGFCATAPRPINPFATGRVPAVALPLGFSRAPFLAVLCKDSAGQKASRSCELHWAAPSKFTLKDLLELAFPIFPHAWFVHSRYFSSVFCFCVKLYEELQLSEYSGGTMQISMG